jgi:hypothetical protein
MRQAQYACLAGSNYVSWHPKYGCLHICLLHSQNAGWLASKQQMLKGLVSKKNDALASKGWMLKRVRQAQYACMAGSNYMSGSQNT